MSIPNCDGNGIRHCVLKYCPNYINEIYNATYDQERTVSQILNEKRDNVLKNSPSNLNEENISVNFEKQSSFGAAVNMKSNLNDASIYEIDSLPQFSNEQRDNVLKNLPGNLNEDNNSVNFEKQFNFDNGQNMNQNFDDVSFYQIDSVSRFPKKTTRHCCFLLSK